MAARGGVLLAVGIVAFALVAGLAEAPASEMSRDQLIQALRRYARKRDLAWTLDKKKGKGSHYRVRVGMRVTTVQKDLNPGRIDLKQLDINAADL